MSKQKLRNIRYSKKYRLLRSNYLQNKYFGLETKMIIHTQYERMYRCTVEENIFSDRNCNIVTRCLSNTKFSTTHNEAAFDLFSQFMGLSLNPQK